MSPSDSFTHLNKRGGDRVKRVSIYELGEPDDRGKQILIMNVDIGDGRTDEIVVYESDEPEDLAREFCERYELSDQICQALSLQIEANIEQLVDEHWKDVEESVVTPRPSVSPLKPKNTPVLTRRNEYEQVTPQHDLIRSYTERSLALSPIKKHAKENSMGTGPRLYEKGVMMKKILRENLSKKLKEKEKQEETELTFSPRLISRRRSSNKSDTQTPTTTERSKSKELKLKKLKDDLDYKEQVACTFKPTLSEGSKTIMKKRSLTAAERVDQLYKEAKELDEKRKCEEISVMKKMCPFKPELHESPIRLKSSEPSPTRLYNKTPPRRVTKTFDASECSFKPKTGRPPRFKRNAQEMSIGAYLYSQKSKRESDDDPKPQDKQIVFAGENSLKIIDKLCYERYEQIYRVFCKPNTLTAAWDAKYLERSDAKLAKVLAPLIDQLARSTRTYDLKAFCEALDKFARKLSPIEKSTLYSTGKPHAFEEMPSFVPQITDYKSLNLKIRSKLSLYERLLQDKEKSRSKVNEKKMRRIEDELYECTFYPKTLEYRKIVRSTSGFAKGDDDDLLNF